MDSNLKKKFEEFLFSWAYFTKFQYENTYDNHNKKTYPYQDNFNNEHKNLTFDTFSISQLEFQFTLVEHCLQLLSDDHRKVINLRYVHKLTWDNISIRTHFSKRNCFYFKERLLKKMEKVYLSICN